MSFAVCCSCSLNCLPWAIIAAHELEQSYSLVHCIDASMTRASTASVRRDEDTHANILLKCSCLGRLPWTAVFFVLLLLLLAFFSSVSTKTPAVLGFRVKGLVITHSSRRTEAVLTLVIGASMQCTGGLLCSHSCAAITRHYYDSVILHAQHACTNASHAGAPRPETTSQRRDGCARRDSQQQLPLFELK